MSCSKIKYDKLGALFALSQAQKVGKYNPLRNECRVYYCKECQAYRLTSKHKYGMDIQR